MKLMIASLLLLSACATVDKTYTARTTASYKSGDTALVYDSSKDQENFKAHLQLDPATGKVIGLDVETSASTPSAAIAATARANEAAARIIEKLLSLVPASALAGS